MGASLTKNARLAYLRALGDFSALPSAGCLMGLDVSRNHIGVAISHNVSAVPVCVVNRRTFAEDMAALKQLVRDHHICGVILGLPLQMDGREGARAQSVRDFAHLLVEALALPLAFWDERLTTKQAERAFSDRRKAAPMVDAVAASLILQAALDCQSNPS